jgi:hypothetical protein
MIEKEAQARHTNLSQFARYAMVMQMKYGNKPEQNAA